MAEANIQQEKWPQGKEEGGARSAPTELDNNHNSTRSTTLQDKPTNEYVLVSVWDFMLVFFLAELLSLYVSQPVSFSLFVFLERCLPFILGLHHGAAVLCTHCSITGHDGRLHGNVCGCRHVSLQLFGRAIQTWWFSSQ